MNITCHPIEPPQFMADADLSLAPNPHVNLYAAGG